MLQKQKCFANFKMQSIKVLFIAMFHIEYRVRFVHEIVNYIVTIRPLYMCIHIHNKRKRIEAILFDIHNQFDIHT